MKKKIEVRIAWKVWNLLVNLNDKIREHYEKDFLDIIIAEIDEELMIEGLQDDFIPF